MCVDEGSGETRKSTAYTASPEPVSMSDRPFLKNGDHGIYSVVGLQDGYVCVYDLSTGALVSKAKAHTAEVHSVLATPSGV